MNLAHYNIDKAYFVFIFLVSTGKPNGAAFVRFFTGASAELAIAGFSQHTNGDHAPLSLNLAGRNDYKERIQENKPPAVKKPTDKVSSKCEHFIRIDGVSLAHPESVTIDLEGLNALEFEVRIKIPILSFSVRSV